MFKENVTRRVDLAGLKAFAQRELPLNSALRDMLLLERDQIGAEEFIVKMEVWLRLFNREMKQRVDDGSFPGKALGIASGKIRKGGKRCNG